MNLSGIAARIALTLVCAATLTTALACTANADYDIEDVPYAEILCSVSPTVHVNFEDMGNGMLRRSTSSTGGLCPVPYTHPPPPP